MELTDNEKEIVRTLRELKPYERLELTADASGKPDFYLIHRSHKVILTSVAPRPVK